MKRESEVFANLVLWNETRDEIVSVRARKEEILPIYYRCTSL